MILETQRLILRPWEIEDAEELYRYASDPQVGPAAGWPVHTGVGNSREIIKGVLSEPETYAVVLKASGKPVGSVGIMRSGHGNVVMGDTEAEIGYWIGVPFWGQGLIPEAVETLLQRCFTELSCTAVWCCHFAGNEKSRRVQEKCGFVYDHTEENKPCPLLRTVRTELVNCMTRAQWMRAVSFTRVQKEAFSVIGMEGTTKSGAGMVQSLWQRANAGFPKIAHLAKRDERGALCGVWGAMTDFSGTFQPWEENFSQGLYLVGVECEEGAEAPDGFTRWNIPGFVYLRTENDGPDCFSRAIETLRQRKIPLVGAVQEYTCPKTGKEFLYFPIQRLP